MLKNRLYLLLLLITVTSVQIASAGEPGRQYPIYPVQSHITIDGILDEPAWQRAPTANDFHRLGGSDEGAQTTRFRMIYDNSNFYFAFVVLENAMDKQLLKCKDGQNVWTDDSIEIFLQTKDSDFDRFAVNAAGIRSHLDTQAAVTRKDDRYIIELRVPFDILLAAPTVGVPFTANICRNNFTAGAHTPVFSSWALLDESFHEPHKFSRFIMIEHVPSSKLASYFGKIVNVDTNERILTAVRKWIKQSDEYYLDKN